MKNQLLPSILSSNFACIGRDLKILEKASIQTIHIDVMDGHFVPNITIGPCVIQSLRKQTHLLFDVHLMIQNPQDYIRAFCLAGADSLTVHLEANHDVPTTIELIRKEGKKVGLAINPDTPCDKIKPFLKQVDLLLVMSVFPGFGGQTFIEESIPKIRLIRKMINSANLTHQIDLQVDGGLNDKTVHSVKNAGANLFVVGNYIFKNRQLTRTIKKLHNIINLS